MAAVILLAFAAVLIGPDGGAEEIRAQVRPGIRLPTAEELKQRMKAEEERKKAEPVVEGLSPRLSYHLRKKFPAHSVLTSQEATEGNQRFAISELGQPSPFVCHADFDGNGLEDSAVILRERATHKLKVMAFHQIHVTVNPGGHKKRGYLAHTIAKAGQMAPGTKVDRLIIICKKPGNFRSVEGGVTLILRNHSVHFGFAIH
jgi:hypothetical protein